MAECPPLVDAQFVALVTGADTSDFSKVDALISLSSALIARELGVTCVDPDQADVRVKVVCAQFVGALLQEATHDAMVRAETVGDYRVEYLANSVRGADLAYLRKLLGPIRGMNYSVTTLDRESPRAYGVGVVNR
jgi:hypothetical protein